MTIRKRKLFRSIICKKKLSRMTICQKVVQNDNLPEKLSRMKICKQKIHHNSLQEYCPKQQFANNLSWRTIRKITKNYRGHQITKKCLEQKVAQFDLNDPQWQHPKSGLKENLQHLIKWPTTTIFTEQQFAKNCLEDTFQKRLVKNINGKFALFTIVIFK